MDQSQAGFEHVRAGGYAVLAVTGEIDLAVQETFGRELSRLAARATSPCFVDLSGVTFMDSSGLSQLAKARERSRKAGVELVLVAPARPVRCVLEVSGLAAVLPIRDELPRRG
jgi:anti-sigma B factor antagonist